MKRVAVCAFATLAAFLVGAVAGVAQPGLDCSRAKSAVEKVICTEPALASADAEMTMAYAALHAALPADQRSALRANQRQWLAERDGACREKGPALARCLTEETEARRRFLVGEGPNGAPRAPRLLPNFYYEESKARRYEISIQYPQIPNPAGAAASEFNNQSRKVAFGAGPAAATEIRNAERPSRDEAAKFYNASYEITYLDSRFASVVFSIASYEGGAHPNGESVALLYSFSRGRPLRLSDFLADPGKAIPAIADRCRREAEKEDWGLFDNPDFVDVVKDISSWSAGSDGIEILFNPYSVAPYVSGPHACRLTYAELMPFLKPGGPLPPHRNGKN